LKGHTAQVKTDVVVSQLRDEKKINAGFVKSVTFDRGPENSDYKEIGRKLNITTYACNPYHSWEKGTVENTIQRIRDLFLKECLLII